MKTSAHQTIETLFSILRTLFVVFFLILPVHLVVAMMTENESIRNAIGYVLGGSFVALVAAFCALFLLSLFHRRNFHWLHIWHFKPLRALFEADEELQYRVHLADDEEIHCIKGLLPVSISQEHIFKERDAEVGDATFDSIINWSVIGGVGDYHHRNADVLSRLSHPIREKLVELVSYGLRIDDGTMYLPVGIPPTSQSRDHAIRNYFDSVYRIADALRAHRADGTPVGRLTEIVLSDPVMNVRVTLFPTLTALLQADKKRLNALLAKLITGDANGIVKDEAAISALDTPADVRALAAIFWLQNRFSKDAIQPVAYAMNHPDASPLFRAQAAKLLTNLQRTYGELSAGSLDIVDAGVTGALELAKQQGQLTEMTMAKRSGHSQKT